MGDHATFRYYADGSMWWGFRPAPGDYVAVPVEELAELLNQTEHVIDLAESGWSIEHLVECRRIPNGMTKCAVHEALNVFSDELLDDHGYGRFRLIGWDDDYPMLAPIAQSEEGARDG